MIYFGFTIKNPFSQKFMSIWEKSFSTPFEHKFIEVQFYKDSSLFSLNLDITARQSHSGLRLEIGLFGFCFEFNFYDNRHWNRYKKQYDIVEE